MDTATKRRTFVNETTCRCPSCKAGRGEWDHGITSGLVHEWDFTPRRWRKLGLKNEAFPYHLGVELETSMAHDEDGDICIYQEQAVGLRRPKNLWFAKYDGSVSGPEFVSHPATLSYWQDKASDLAEMFRLLIHAGYRSHNGNRAGMHVNIDKSAFSDGKHLHRFLTFIYVNRRWSVVMSQRQESQVEQWAVMRPYSLDDAEQMLETTYNYHRTSVTNKYDVVNAPHGAERLEFRLPRGTLRLDRFYKNLEWTAALIAWTRRNDFATHNKLYVRDFQSWVMRHGVVYSNLVAFVREKGGDLYRAMDEDDEHRFLHMNDCQYDPLDQPDVFGPLPLPPEELRRLEGMPLHTFPTFHTYSTT